MAIIRRLPYRAHFGIEQQLQDIQRRMSALNPSGSGSERGAEPRQSASFHPSVDVYRDDDADELVVEIELPGVDVDNDVDVSVHEGTLMIRGSRTSERSEEHDGVYLTERRTGSFSRSMALPDGVDVDSVRADYDAGVLTIRMPIPDETDRSREPRQIEIGRGRSTTRDGGADDRGLNVGADSSDSPTESSHDDAAAAKKTASKKSASKKAAAKKSAAKKSASKKGASKKSAAKRSQAERASSD